MKLADIPVPDVEPLSDKEWNSLVFAGPYNHVGPVHGFTPLQNALSEKTNCACYLLMTGLVGILKNLTSARIDGAFHEKTKEFIYLYQFDWRFPIPWVTDAEFISEREPTWDAVKQTIPFYFLTILYRFGTPFCANPVMRETSYMINFTLHLAGKDRAEQIKPWITQMIGRLDQAAPCPGQTPLYYSDYPSEAEFLQAALGNHGSPLSPRILDSSVPLAEIDHRKEALAIVDATNFGWNAVLRAPADFERSCGIDGPYFSADREW